MNDNKKVLVAMSGGVDSAVAALLLSKSYDITGITMRLWDNGTPLPNALCCDPDQNATDAKAIADILGFPHCTVSLGESFKSCVVDRFISDYRHGKTPNPCVECNKCIKFGKLFEVASDMGFEYLATGHYARITQENDGSYRLRTATDKNKDQSYFLWSIKRSLLPFILFPLGEMNKSQIRAIASANGLPSASRSDSQDICFVPDGDYISFIKDQGFNISSPGDFVDIEGKRLGEHQGIERYTIGQRKGLGIALGKPIFVGKKDVMSNTVTLCSDDELYTDSLSADSVNILADIPVDTPTRLEAKIRFRHSPAPATVTLQNDGNLKVVFDQPQRAISPGQSVVLYDGDIVIGGGIIK